MHSNQFYHCKLKYWSKLIRSPYDLVIWFTWWMSVKCFVLPIENNSKNNFHHCIVSNVLTLACRAVMSYFLSIQNVCIKVWRCNCTEIKMKVVVIAAIVSALGRLLLQSFYFKCKQTISDNLTACTNNKYVNESRWGGAHHVGNYFWCTSEGNQVTFTFAAISRQI